MGQNIVHVIGTGTIGEPLVGLLARHKSEFNIDEVTFHKNMPYSHDRPKLLQMIAQGANMATRKDRMEKFKEQGIEVAYEQEEAIARATVVIDCTPSGIGIDNKTEFYEKYRDKVRGFIAQGSEFGFGTMYARGINDEVLDEKDPQFVHVVSCNTHNLAALLQTLGDDGAAARRSLRPAVRHERQAFGIPARHVRSQVSPSRRRSHDSTASRAFGPERSRPMATSAAVLQSGQNIVVWSEGTSSCRYPLSGPSNTGLSRTRPTVRKVASAIMPKTSTKRRVVGSIGSSRKLDGLGRCPVRAGRGSRCPGLPVRPIREALSSRGNPEGGARWPCARSCRATAIR